MLLSICRTSIAFLHSVFFLSSAGRGVASPAAYEVLQSYDFPVGILPKGVIGYDLDVSSGKFNAYLNGSCGFSLEGSYQLKYKSKISGNIYKKKLTNLSGVSVKVFFVWLNIVEVRRDGENLEFSVGIASAEFSMNNFYVCPQCGCGLNCKTFDEGGGKGNDLGNNPLVSSI